MSNKKSYAGMGLTRKQIARMKRVDQYNAETNTPEQQLEKALRFLNNQTIEQREAYYTSVVNWEKGSYQRRIDEVAEKLQNTTREWDKTRLQLLIEDLEEKQRNLPIHTHMLNWLRYAKEDFDAKILKVAQKLVEFGFCGLRAQMDVVDVSNTHSRGLDFYIKCQEYSYSYTEYEFGQPAKVYEDKGRAYARLVWVSCYDKASHWRFICTKKS
jgi:hypothetical protein